MRKKRSLLLLLHKGVRQNITYMKQRLINEGYLEDKCSICGWSTKYEGSQYSNCELDHINGNNSDWRRINLRMLCPNCHSQTDTYKGRNPDYKKSFTIWTVLQFLKSTLFRKILSVIFWIIIIVIILSYILKAG